MTKPKETYKPANLSESLIITVRFSETDPLGIVWHGNYIKYFEDGREAFGRKYGISYLDLERYGERLRIETHYIPSNVAKLIFQYFIYNEANELVCKGETVQVFTSLKDNSLSLYKPTFYEEWEKKVISDK